MFGNKKAKENSLEDIKAIQEETAENSSNAPAEEVTSEENSATPMEETGEVPEENMENLAVSSEDAVATEDGTDASPKENANVAAVMAENRALKEEIKSLREALEQSGQLAKEGVAAVAIGDGDDVDFSALVYGDEGARKSASAKLFGQLLEALRTEAAPIIAERDEAKKAAEMARAIKVLSSMEDDFPGFGGQVDALNALIGRDAILQAHTNPMEKMITAYIMKAGIEAIDKNKKGLSVDEFMDLYRKNNEFRGAIEKERLEKLKEEPQLPPMPVSSSLSTHEPYTNQGPETMEEANKSLREMRRKLRK